jgi:hypothetical protein
MLQSADAVGRRAVVVTRRSLIQVQLLVQYM